MLRALLACFIGFEAMNAARAG